MKVIEYRRDYMREYMREYIKTHPEYVKKQCDKYRFTRLKFKDRMIYLKEDPRTHICSKCGREGLTHLHHLIYHEDDPLKDTVELCPSCHCKERIGMKYKK